MKIQILGSGCATCKKLYEMTAKVVKELGLSENVEYITGEAGTTKIIELGVMQSPVLTINDKPVIVGSIPDANKLIKVINEYSNKK